MRDLLVIRVETPQVDPTEGAENKCFSAGMLACESRDAEASGVQGSVDAPSQTPMALRNVVCAFQGFVLATDRSVPTAATTEEISLSKAGFVSDFAALLLRRLALRLEGPALSDPSRELHPHFEWARCGAMALSGLPEGPPLLAPAPLASASKGALLALRSLAGKAWRGGDLDAARLLGERAAVFGFKRRGLVSPGGSCRLIRATDGWLAVNLARESDREMVPAWLELEVEASGDLWSQVEIQLGRQKLVRALSRARLMGLPVAPATDLDLDACDQRGSGSWLELTRGPNKSRQRSHRAPIVLDLSSLWAGPLCAQLLGLAGAKVIKLESLERPDGARAGPSQFFDLLNAGKQSVALEFGSVRGRASLEQLLERADIVIESTRPRALAQFGIVAEDWVARRSNLTWVSITGYGRSEPEAGWVAFGDDAGAAAGLSTATALYNQSVHDGSLPPVFCGDAIADPLTGMHAAVAALASWQSDESRLLDISLCSVVRHVLCSAGSDWDVASTGAFETAQVEHLDRGRWQVRIGDEVRSVEPPRARSVVSPAATLGADTNSVLASLGVAG